MAAAVSRMAATLVSFTVMSAARLAGGMGLALSPTNNQTRR